VGHSLGYGICIFDITKQFQFQKIGWVVLDHVWYFLPIGIVSITTLVWIRDGDEVPTIAFVYVSDVKLFLDSVRVCFDVIFWVTFINKDMC